MIRTRLSTFVLIPMMLVFLFSLRPTVVGASTSPQLKSISSDHVLFVRPNTTGDCSSWSEACDLQAALSLADPGNEVWVAAGVYYPGSTSDPRTVTFQLENGVAVYGGFKGSETTQEQRDWQANPSILSGDIDRNDLTSSGVITYTANIIGGNAYHVVTGRDNDATAILDGFIITAGKANDNEGSNYGGGMVIFSGNATLRNLIFTGNAGTLGGGMVNGGSPTLTNVTFTRNSAFMIGGGMANMGNPILTNAVFFANTAAEYGGGMCNFSLASPSLTNVTFYANSAMYGGGIANVETGGATLFNTILWGNTATSGPQIYVDEHSTSSVSFSLIQEYTITPGTGNLNEDPLFMHAASGNLRLQPGSPAIDKGDNAAIPAEVVTDMDGNPRIVDYRGSGALVDMGAYEAQLIVEPPPVYLPLMIK